ncbi:LysR substrate-binding domain-containing protein [Crenobacter sp. SG2303]|uniref:LysR substrate-binding domain-containing protein n=1 Tax=Crenobacter oryzisoli TaxID=3056844 RepID=A0ABT7XP16_9NEIS|nr:LysR substrate-binding domain-containing protein [Crenobacter sp. SG2303]MDN0075540.1 LysR substrate-binding domain-containing protein [Crenobacter sp. SG2303]
MLARAELVVIAPAASEPMTIAEFDGAPTVGFPETDHIGRLFADACAQHGVTPAVTTCVQTFQIARELVAQGGGLALVDPFTASLSSGAGIVARPLSPAIGLGVCALTVRGMAVGDSVAQMIDAFAGVAQRVVSTD